MPFFSGLSSTNAIGIIWSWGLRCSSRTTRTPASPAPTMTTRRPPGKTIRLLRDLTRLGQQTHDDASPAYEEEREEPINPQDRAWEPVRETPKTADEDDEQRDDYGSRRGGKKKQDAALERSHRSSSADKDQRNNTQVV